MNVHNVIAQFDHIVDTPEAIAQLRLFILELAVRGKLVDRDPKDEPVSQLLRKVQEVKQNRLSNDAPMKLKSFPQIQPHETSFDIPETWRWVRLGAITHVVMGQSPPGETYNKDGEGVPLINGPVEFTEGPFGKTVVNQYTTAPTNFCEEGDLLICVRGSTTGRTNVAGFRACIGRGVAAIRSFFPDGYVRLFLWRQRNAIIAMGRGIAFPSVSRQQIEELPIPLPPLKEQHRIVAKVDELMSLCDYLEEARRQEDKQRDRAALSTLHHLRNGASPADFRRSSRFYLDHLDDFTAKPSQIPELRREILSLAVRGKLLPQNLNDEASSELLKRIQADKLRRIEDGDLRKERPLPIVTDSEVPFTLPSNWMWTRIGTCALLTEYGTSVRSDERDDGVPVLAMGHIQNGNVILNARKKVPRQIEDLPQLLLKRFDLLYNRTNSAELVGKTGIYLGDDDAFTFASYLIRIRFNPELVSPKYVNLAMNAPYFRETQIVPELRQQCGQANVNGTKLRNMMIPIPPIEEQVRIVTRVEELMALCHGLETRLSTTLKQKGILLESVLYHSLLDARSGSMIPANS